MRTSPSELTPIDPPQASRFANTPPQLHRREAKRVLKNQSDSDDSEKQYLLEYYALVRAGKTNYVSTLAFQAITGTSPQLPPDFFKAYAEEFHPQAKQPPSKRRKVDSS